MIRRTLGWTDAFGNPQEEQLAIPHSQIIAKAGVSSAHVRGALDELLALRAIECLREPQASSKGKTPVVEVLRAGVEKTISSGSPRASTDTTARRFIWLVLALAVN